MPKIVRTILLILTAVLITAGMAAAFYMGVSYRAPMKCKGLKVEIVDSLENNFVSKADVKRFLDKEYGTYKGEVLDSIDLIRVEQIIDGRSAVNKCQAYVTPDGYLNISVSQRTPIVRFQKADGGFYADADGFLFPLQSSYSSRVQIVDGEIPLKANSGYKGEISDPSEKAWLMKVLDVVSYMENSKVWKGKIVQISVCRGGELIMVPRSGEERFLFGQPEDIKEKFKRMEMYYSHILPEKGSGTYKSVSVKYDGQIVCK